VTRRGGRAKARSSTPRRPATSGSDRRRPSAVWALVVVPLIPLVVALVEQWHNLPWSEPAVAPKVTIEAVAIEAGDMKLGAAIDAADPRRAELSGLLGCDGVLLAVRYTSSGMKGEAPLLRWTLLDRSSEAPWPVPAALNPVRIEKAQADGGVKKLWVPAPNLERTFTPIVDAFVDAQHVPDDPSSTKHGPPISTFPDLANTTSCELA
jgi:hypothetical protein